MFFRELEIPLVDIKKIMENPDYDKEQALLTQRVLLALAMEAVEKLAENYKTIFRLDNARYLLNEMLRDSHFDIVNPK